MPRYTDEDVQRLVRIVNDLTNFSTFRNGFPIFHEGLTKRIKPFEPDPWEELHQYRLSQHVISVDTTQQLIDKAVELGLVTLVEEE